VSTPGLDLVVLYCEDLAGCRAFYAGLGLGFTVERHGTGAEHHACVLADGTVLELYPAGEDGATGALRLGLTVQGSSARPAQEPGRRLLRDPDGRAVVLTVLGDGGRDSTALGNGHPADALGNGHPAALGNEHPDS
jgi:catechol 2,3-dioxygenase-like lactoylglutathione lyase family enzyme